MKMKKSHLVPTIISTVIVCLFAVFPFLWMISTAFKPSAEVFSYPPSFIPREPHLDGFREILQVASPTFNFLNWAKNSIKISAFTTLFSLIIATMGGYGISRFRFFGRKILAYTILVTQVIPGSVLIVPLYIIMSNMNLLDTSFGLVLAYVTFSVPFCTWMMKGFFDTIPSSLDEAAMVDGAGRFAIFARIIVPLTIPGLLATGIFSFITGWNEFLFASVFMSSYANWTLPVGISSFQGQYETNWATLMAGSLFITVPVVVVFLVLQKYLVGGMTAGAVKQ